MTPEVEVALEGSIAKWRAIVAGTGTDLGTRNCPLCKMFIDKNCRGCPVRERTGFSRCQATPYGGYVSEVFQRGTGDLLARAAARKELEFLESLRVPFDLQAEGNVAT
jgi:hypothetical protein